MNPDAARGSWMRRFASPDVVRLRLFCFPSAGGGASLFGSWPRALPAGVEVCGVQLPGREDRIGEPLLRRVDAAVCHLIERVDVFAERPFVFYGHSMGALIAFELARALRRQGADAPRHLFCSASRAPQDAGTGDRLYDLPDAAFIDRVRAFGGIPEPILHEAELMRMLTPILKADFELLQTYQYRDEPAFHFPITALGGSADTHAVPETLDAWRRQTTATFNQVLFPHGHFFIRSIQDTFLGTLSAALRPLVSPAVG